MELQNYNKQKGNIPGVDIRDVKLVDGVGLVRVGPPEYSESQAQAEKRIDGIIEHILYGEAKKVEENHDCRLIGGHGEDGCDNPIHLNDFRITEEDLL